MEHVTEVHFTTEGMSCAGYVHFAKQFAAQGKGPGELLYSTTLHLEDTSPIVPAIVGAYEWVQPREHLQNYLQRDFRRQQKGWKH